MRRAWIEILMPVFWSVRIMVALHAESVDRNAFGADTCINILLSLSMRRAWIEIHVRNIKQYLLACLYNAPSTINNGYDAMVNHDMASSGIPP